MSDPKDVSVYFNFRSPYCYLASKTMFSVFDAYRIRLRWRPLGGWDGRSPPDRAKVKIPSTRQDVARWCRRLGVPFNPPPVTTDPTRAGAGSLLAEEKGVLRAYIVEMMRAEWSEGNDIGNADAIIAVGTRVGLDPGALSSAIDDPARHAQLQANWVEAQDQGVIGVPTFVVDDEIFWGNDRLEFLREHLHELRLVLG